MTQTRLAGEDRVVEVSGGRTVVVGVKLDSHSRELLTWALVKVAQPGDCVIALHVLNNNEIVDRDGKSSLLSLIKAFDSVLAVYEGFCNLKQVDLKLKVCRGSSIRKVLVREAKFYLANEVIVGTSQNHHTICSSASVAKYCAKNLPKDCSILAVDNGKVVFQRKASPPMANGRAKGIDDQGRHHLLSAIQSSASKNSKLLHGANVDENSTATTDQITCESLESALVRARWDCAERALKKKCSICSPNSVSLESSCFESTESSAGDSDEDNSKAIVPVKKIEAPLSPISSLIRELPEVKPGWPLLHRAIFSDRQVSDRSSVKRISAVQWALQLPSRHCLHSADSNQTTCNENKEQSSEFDEESGSIVSVGAETVSSPSSPSSSSRSLPEELKGLHEKYSESCRLFKYQELLQATSNFIPENLIGKGGSSRVYRGCLPDGKELAVKILKQSTDLLKEFVLEIEIITALHHKNIISLFGFCFEDCNLLMVYDFLSRGSLEENLHGNKKDSRAFGWSERFKVAVGVAEALEYLHNLSDFGLAKWASTSSSHITCTDVAGTFGYLAPEYFMFGKVNEKIDVYAFGVVLLELLSGRKPISNDHPKGQESLVMWAKSILKRGKVSQLLDPSMGNKYDHNQMERMVLAATLCIRRAPRARPQMSIVLKLLQGDSEVIKWARLQVHASEGTDMLDGEALPRLNLQSHLNVALLDVEEDSLSLSSIEQSASLKDYLQGRWSRSASFD